MPNFQIGGQRDAAVGADAGGEATRAAPGELLDEHRVGDRVVVAAVLGRELQPDVAELGEPPEHLVREPARVLPFARVRPEFGLHEPADGLAELLVLGGERRDRPPRGRVPAPALDGVQISAVMIGKAEP